MSLVYFGQYWTRKPPNRHFREGFLERKGGYGAFFARNRPKY